MKGMSWLFLIIVAVALAATKPNEAAHRAAIARRTPVARALFGVQEVLGNAEMEYHDYLIFSTMTFKFEKTGPEMPLSYGFLGKIYYDKDE